MIFGTYGEHENFFTLKGEIDALLDQLNVHPADLYRRHARTRAIIPAAAPIS